jgi:hypothetical protein
MPFAAQRRHQYWSVDVRYVEEHGLESGKPVYVISILENFSQALLASAISPRQDLTAFLIVFRAAVEAHEAPVALVSDGGVFRANQARAIYRALGIEKREIDRGQAWQNSVETHFNVMRRIADHHYATATSWAELQAVHNDRPTGRRNPASVLRWVQGPGATRPTSTASSGCERRGCSTPAGTCASGTGGATGNEASPGSGRRSGRTERR